MLKGNVKNAPAGRYFSEDCFGNFLPYVMKSASKSGKTITLQKITVAYDPDFKIAADRLSNVGDQTWIFARVEESWILKIRLNKKGQWVSKGTVFHETDGPLEFNDAAF